MDTSNVTVGKPKIAGAIYRAVLGTKLPTSATEELDSAFEELGYCSEDGLVNSNSAEFEDYKAWGGDIVYSSQTEKTDTFNFSLIEVMKKAVLQTIYGEDHVTGDLASGLTVEANNEELPESSYVFDLLLNGAMKRIVVPKGKITETGDVTYSDDELTAYEATITCYPINKITHYEYIVSSATTTEGQSTKSSKAVSE